MKNNPQKDESHLQNNKNTGHSKRHKENTGKKKREMKNKKYKKN